MLEDVEYCSSTIGGRSSVGIYEGEEDTVTQRQVNNFQCTADPLISLEVLLSTGGKPQVYPDLKFRAIYDFEF